MLIRVTQEDIARGKPRCHELCPVALAICREFNSLPSVGPECIVLGHRSMRTPTNDRRRALSDTSDSAARRASRKRALSTVAAAAIRYVRIIQYYEPRWRAKSHDYKLWGLFQRKAARAKKALWKAVEEVKGK